MNIALIGTFDSASLTDGYGQVRLAAIRAAIASHLDRAPMLRRVLRQTRLGQGRPVWIDAQRFRIEDHVVLVRPSAPSRTRTSSWHGPHAGRPSRSIAAARCGGWTWSGLPGGRIGVVIAVHHVVADGLRGVEMIGGLLDQAADEVVGPELQYRPEPQPTAAELVVDNVRNRIAALRRFRPGVIGRGLRAVGDVGRERARHAPATVLGGRSARADAWPSSGDRWSCARRRTPADARSTTCCSPLSAMACGTCSLRGVSVPTGWSCERRRRSVRCRSPRRNDGRPAAGRHR